jgi:hypothetical protein
MGRKDPSTQMRVRRLISQTDSMISVKVFKKSRSSKDSSFNFFLIYFKSIPLFFIKESGAKAGPVRAKVQIFRGGVNL